MYKVLQMISQMPEANGYIEQQSLHSAFFQLAGHPECFKAGTRFGTILKKSTGNEEVCLKDLMNDDRLSPFVPKIFRTIKQDGQHYLELQDLLVNFKNPCIMDIKMGSRTYLEENLDAKMRHDMYVKMIEVDSQEPTDEERKVEAITKSRYMIWRDTVSSTASFGFRIEGMRLWDGTVDKEFKTTKDEEQISKTFMKYARSDKILMKYLNRLYDLKHALMLSNFFWTHELIGSSLLFVHDDNEANIWMIDFAKTNMLPENKKITHKKKWEIGNHEDGYLTGVESLIRLFETLISRTSSGDRPVSTQNADDTLRATVAEVHKIDYQKLEILTNDSKRIQLEGVWAENQIFKNSVIHLVNSMFNSATGVYSINNSTGFLIIDPDILLTPTLIASSLWCERKAWLNGLLSGQVGTNRAMLVGTLVHEVFQYGVRDKVVDISKLTEFLDEQLDDATVMLEIYSVELHLNEIRAEAISYIPSIKEWIQNFMLSGQQYPLSNDSNLEARVIGIADIEENVSSTKFGLKGRVDVTGSVRIHDKRNNTTKEKTIPLELKTGNPNLSSSHAAQVSLYSMMMEDKYSDTNQGFVIYLKNRAAMHNVPLTHNIKRDLIQRRNQINYYMKSYFSGPEMLNSTRMCINCDRLPECILMSNMFQPGKIDEYSDMKSLEAEAVGHLDDEFIAFFKKYHEKMVAAMAFKNSTTPIRQRVMIRLLAREDWRCDRVRQLVLDPTYKPINNVKLNLFVLTRFFEEIVKLESSKHQKFVVEAVATDNYYILDEVVEPDKTKVDLTVLVLLQVITSLDRSILIVAQNIDNLVNLMKLLRQNKLKFILIDDGKSTKARYQFSNNLVRVIQNENWDLAKKFDSYIKQHETAPIVITTYAMSIGGLLFIRKTFDYCIAYDCDSTELLVGLSPMFCSDRHIIIDIKDKNPANGCLIEKDKTLGEHLRSLRGLTNK